MHLQETEYLALYRKGLLSSTRFLHSHIAHDKWSKGSGTMDMNVLKDPTKTTPRLANNVKPPCHKVIFGEKKKQTAA